VLSGQRLPKPRAVATVTGKKLEVKELLVLLPLNNGSIYVRWGDKASRFAKYDHQSGVRLQELLKEAEPTPVGGAGEKKSDASPKRTKNDPVKSAPRLTVVIDDVAKYVKRADVPKRNGPVTFSSDGKIVEKNGAKVIEARYRYGYNGFSLGYDLAGVLKADQLEKREFTAADFASITIKYTDDLLDRSQSPARKGREGFDRAVVRLCRLASVTYVRIVHCVLLKIWRSWFVDSWFTMLLGHNGLRHFC
jgi:hypothetical protein